MKPGQILQNKYRIDEELTAKGGFGVVYLGTDLGSGTRVAVKEIKPRKDREKKDDEITLDPAGDWRKEKEAFLEEARLLELLRDVPQVVQLYSYSDEGDTAYIVMELLQGGTLRKKLAKEGKLPPEEAYRIIVELLMILEKVHRRYIIHRDIAPDNIYLLTSGRVKLFDFGVSVIYQKERRKKEWIAAKKKGYSPLEQLQKSSEQGPWTDVYAAAATYYEMLTGKKPPGADERKTKDELIPPTKAEAAISAEEERVILDALAVDANKRIRTAGEFLSRLQNAHGKKRKRKKGTGLVIAAAAALLLGGGFFFLTGAAEKRESLNNKQEYLNAGMAEEILEAEDTAKALSTETKKEYPEPSSADLAAVQSVTVPDVTGMDEDEASERLKQYELTYSKTAEVDRTVPQGLIIRQEPEAGTEAEPGTEVRIVISLGSPEEETTAPLVTLAPRETEAPTTAAPTRQNNNAAPPATQAPAAPIYAEPPTISENIG